MTTLLATTHDSALNRAIRIIYSRDFLATSAIHLVIGSLYQAYGGPYPLLYLQLALIAYNTLANPLLDYIWGAKGANKNSLRYKLRHITSESTGLYMGAIRSTLLLSIKGSLENLLPSPPESKLKGAFADAFALISSSTMCELTKESARLSTYIATPDCHFSRTKIDWWLTCRVWCNYTVRAFSKAIPVLIGSANFAYLDSINYNFFSSVYNTFYDSDKPLIHHEIFYKYWLRSDVWFRGCGDLCGAALSNYMKEPKEHLLRHFSIGLYRAVCYYIIDSSLRSFREFYGYSTNPLQPEFFIQDLAFSLVSDFLRGLTSSFGGEFVFNKTPSKDTSIKID